MIHQSLDPPGTIGVLEPGHELLFLVGSWTIFLGWLLVQNRGHKQVVEVSIGSPLPIEVMNRS